MLCKALTVMDKDIWKKCPSTTNAVERQNLASKASQAISLNHAMTDLYCLDKAALMEHIASEQGLNITYRDHSEEARWQEVLSKRQQRLKKMTHSDVATAYGPPDKEQHFRGVSTSCIIRNFVLNIFLREGLIMFPIHMFTTGENV